MPVHISDIMHEFAKNVRKLLGDSLDSVIVYGSYARGDYSEFSDIDVMLLVSLEEEEIKRISDFCGGMKKSLAEICFCQGRTRLSAVPP